MNKNNKNSTNNIPFHHINKEKENQEKQDFWLKISAAGTIYCIVMFIVLINQEDATTNAFIFGGLLIAGIIATIFSVVKVNIYKAKSQNMSAEEYMQDRFEKAIPETIETFNLGKNNNSTNPNVACPYCKSANVSKISTLSRAVSVELLGLASSKVGKQWHCNNCKSDF